MIPEDVNEAEYRKTSHLLVVDGYELLSLHSAVILACADLTDEEQVQFGLKALLDKLEKAQG